MALVIPLLGGTLSGCPEVSVTPVNPGQQLCQEFFEACVNPILVSPITVDQTGQQKTCAAPGCHHVDTGPGGALKLDPLARPGSDAIQANFISAKSFANISDPPLSKLLLKPLAGSLSFVDSHAGGDIFADPNDLNYQEILYWISHPQDLAEASCPQLDHFPDDPTRRCLADDNL